MQITEEILDQLHDLQARRIAEIQSKGQSFTITGSDKEFPGLVADDNRLFFLPGAPVAPGQVVKSRTTEVIIKNVSAKAGRIEAETVPVTTRVEILRRHTTGKDQYAYSRQSVGVPASFSRGDMIFPASQATAVNDIVKSATGAMWSVTRVIFNQGVSIASIEEYQPVQPKHLGPRTPEAPDFRQINRPLYSMWG